MLMYFFLLYWFSLFWSSSFSYFEYSLVPWKTKRVHDWWPSKLVQSLVLILVLVLVLHLNQVSIWLLVSWHLIVAMTHHFASTYVYSKIIQFFRLLCGCIKYKNFNIREKPSTYGMMWCSELEKIMILNALDGILNFFFNNGKILKQKLYYHVCRGFCRNSTSVKYQKYVRKKVLISFD